MQRLFTLFTVLLFATLSAFAQGDSPYARFGYEGKVLRTPQERQQRMMLVVPNPDTMATVAKVGLDPAKQRYYLFDKKNQILGSDTLAPTTVSRFLSVDPLANQYWYLTPYQYASNSPISGIDRDGLEFDPAMMGINQRHIREYNAKLYRDDPKHAAQIIRNHNISAFAVVGGALTAGSGPLAMAFWDSFTLFSVNRIRVGLKTSNANEVVEGTYGAAGVAAGGLIGEGLGAGYNAFFRPAVKPISSSVLQAVSVVEEDGFAVVRDAAGREVGRGSINGDGGLSLTIMTKGTGLEKRGGEVMSEIFKYVNSNYDEITSINAIWREGALGDNLSTFNKLVGELGESEAARRTFTGKMAGRLGFKNAKVTNKVMNADGSYQGVDVKFTK